MSFRVFEGQNHAKLYREFRQHPPKNLIDRIIGFLREKYSGSLQQAVDLGCGSGQCTFLIAKHFDRVLGTDISAAQIYEADEEVKRLRLENVTFSVAPAELIPLEDQSTQLITICTAAHWMFLPKVYEEGRRVLCPGGVMALICSDVMAISFENNDSKTGELKKHLDWINEFLKEYFAAPVQLVLDKYKDIEIPYSDFVREYDFKQNNVVSLSTIIGSIRSYSAYQTYCKKKGEVAGEEFMEKVKNGFLNISGLTENEMDNPVFIQSVEYFLLMARI